jgi:two-component system sensor histidine kinase HydH
MGEGVVGAVAASGKATVVTHLDQDPRLIRPATGEDGFQTMAIVPLKAQEQVIGTLGVATRQHREFSAEEMELLVAIGHQIGVAVENARLRQQASEMERLAAVGRVAGTVAHDLRSPLGGIIRSAEFLARPELSDATRQKLSQAIVAMSRRLLSSAQEILDFTRSAPLTLQPAPHGLPQFLEGILEVLRVDFSDRGIEVLTDWGYTGKLWIDANRVAQVVYNIAANARDAMAEGGRLAIRTQQVGPWVEMRFSDTGPGVPAELAERIFEPFFSHGKREGAGLGLAIARRIVHEHSGELYLENPAGRGATFVVRLPVRTPEELRVMAE